MARPRVTNQLDTACAAYIAGLVDGEGTITLSRIHRNERRRLVVCISNNDVTPRNGKYSAGAAAARDALEAELLAIRP